MDNRSGPRRFRFPWTLLGGPALTALLVLVCLYGAYSLAGPDFPPFSGINTVSAALGAIAMLLIGWLAGRHYRRADPVRSDGKTEPDLSPSQKLASMAEALRESEARFRTFVDHAADALFIHDTEDFGRIMDVNRQACESLGFNREEMLGSYPREFDVGLPPHEVVRIGKRVAGGETFAFETRHRRKDGSEFPVEIRVRPFLHGGRRMSVALGRDITDRKQAEKALNDSHELLRAVVESTPDAIFVEDMEGRYCLVNSAGACFLGKPAEQVSGRMVAEFLTPEAARDASERDRRILDTGATETFEEILPAPIGPRTYLSTKVPYRDRQGNVIGLVRIARDVTELKRLEIQLGQAQKMEALGRLAGGVSHDFNNLLTVITGYGEMASNRLGPGHPCSGLIAEIRKSAERAATLTRQLLAFSRKQVLLPQVLNLNPLLSDLFKMLQRLIGGDIELRLVLDPSLGKVKVDPGQFEQAVVNLAVNARDAMRGAGRMSIGTRNETLDESFAERHSDVRPGHYAVIWVSDTGGGMDDATKARIFEPFFTTKSAGKGTGLGLAMVYGFVRQSGGHIEVASEPGGGTTFTLFLPRSEEGWSPAPPTREDDADSKGDETILLVEDEEAVRTLTRLVLQSHGYKVIEAGDGQEGLRIAQEHPGIIHLLVTDLVMPRMGGRELAEVLARERPEIRILFMSGHTEDAALHRGEIEAGEIFVHKPFSPLVLARKIRRLLDAEIPAR